jgi:hypothetical protein
MLAADAVCIAGEGLTVDQAFGDDNFALRVTAKCDSVSRERKTPTLFGTHQDKEVGHGNRPEARLLEVASPSQSLDEFASGYVPRQLHGAITS